MEATITISTALVNDIIYNSNSNADGDAGTMSTQALVLGEQPMVVTPQKVGTHFMWECVKGCSGAHNGCGKGTPKRSGSVDQAPVKKSCETA